MDCVAQRAVSNLVFGLDLEVYHRTTRQVAQEKRAIVGADLDCAMKLQIVVKVSQPVLDDRRVFPSESSRAQRTPFDLYGVQSLPSSHQLRSHRRSYK